MRKRFWACLMLAVFLLLSLVTAPAQAAVWPVDISSLPDGPLVTGSNGSVTAFRCDWKQNSEPIAGTWSSNGERVNAAVDSTIGCAQGTVGAGHVMYLTSSQPESLDERTVAVHNNKQLWRKSLA